MNKHNVSLTISAVSPKQYPKNLSGEIAFAGRSNVGKSSLINKLLNRKSLARVSSTPGKTITVNFYDIDGKLFLVDLPGYGFAKRSPEDKKRWSALTDGYFTNNPQIDLLRGVIQLVDCRSGATDDDLMMIDFLSQSQIPFIICVTKTDKLSKTALGESLDKIAEDCGVSRDELVPFSSLTRAGKDELWNRIFKLID